MNVAIYARVSTAQQAEHGYSLETQIDLCRKKAEEIGVTSIKEYIDDGYSGAYLERPALDALRDAIDNKMHDVVIVYDTDRLARDTMILLLITEQIENSGAKLMFVNTTYDTTPEGQLFFEIKGSFAKYERMKIQDRFARGRRGKLRRGFPIMDSHVFGYDFIDGKYVINEQEADVIRLIFDYYINHVGGQKNIIKMLQDKGIPSPQGTPTWRASVICNLLKRQMYTGDYYAQKVYRKKTGINKTTDIKRDPSEWIPMSCPAIISKEIFEKAEEKRNRNKIQKIRESKYQSLIQGVAYCGICGRKIAFKHHHDKSKIGNYDFYKCNSLIKPNKPCGNRTMQSYIVDTMVWDIIEKVCYNEKMMKKYLALHQEEAKRDNIKKDIQKELDALVKKREGFMNLFSANLITLDECTEKLQVLKKKEEALKAQLPTATNKIDITGCVKDSKRGITFEDKRNFIVNHVEKVTIIRKGSKYGKDYDLDIAIRFK